MARPTSSKTGKSGPLSSNGSIYVVTTGGLEINLLTQVLEKEIGAKCFTVQRIEHVQDIQGPEHPLLTLILLDCFGKNKEMILTELNLCGRKVAFQHLVGLFNISPEIGIENETVKQGVRGLFYEDDDVEHFFKGVRALCGGELWVSRKIMAQCIEENSELAKKRKSASELPPLTRREKEILDLIAVGSSNDEIADKLCLSQHTVKSHISSIFKKINVPNRFQAALWATENL